MQYRVYLYFIKHLIMDQGEEIKKVLKDNLVSVEEFTNEVSMSESWFRSSVKPSATKSSLWMRVFLYAYKLGRK